MSDLISLAGVLNQLWPAAVLGVGVGIGYLFRSGLIIMIAGLGFVIFGFTLWTTLTWLSIITVLVGFIVTWIGAKS